MNIIEAQAYHLKAPLDIPYKTTFGTMTHRQAVFVLLTSEDGVSGIGETYINFPVWSPFGRLASYREVFFPAVVGVEIDDIPDFMQKLWRRYFRASMQGNCFGDTMQALCAISSALWDISAKQAGKPLRHVFSSSPAERVRIYGSGINPPFPVEAIKDGLDMGMDVFKLKLGYGKDRDTQNIEELKKILGVSARVSVDVNRSWSFAETMSWMNYLRDNDIVWLEEPLDMVNQHRYPELLEKAAIPISAGENFLIPPGTDFTCEKEWGLNFNDSQLALDIVQPSVVKNCCFSDAVKLLHLTEAKGKKIFPHFLGSAPGMAASAQLASLTKEPHLEWDINPNPLRTACFSEPFRGVEGYLELSSEPGIGWEVRGEVLDEWMVGFEKVII